jgi:hypothetical protein
MTTGHKGRTCVGFTTASSTMVQSDEHLYTNFHHFPLRYSIQLCDEPDATRVLLIGRVVQPSRRRNVGMGHSHDF